MTVFLSSYEARKSFAQRKNVANFIVSAIFQCQPYPAIAFAAGTAILFQILAPSGIGERAEVDPSGILPANQLEAAKMKYFWQALKRKHEMVPLQICTFDIDLGLNSAFVANLCQRFTEKKTYFIDFQPNK